MSYQLMTDIDFLPISSINVGKRERKLKEDTVKKIYVSILEHGLIQPIGVRRGDQGYDLVFGAHRLEAWRKRLQDGDMNDKAHLKKWSEIPCIVYKQEMTKEEMKLIELRENLERSELTASERKEHAIKLGKLMTISANGTNGKATKSKSANGSNSDPIKRTQGGGVQKGWFADWYEAAKIPKKTATNWWKQYTDAKGIKITPAKADASVQKAFFAWQEKVAKEPKLKPKVKPEPKATKSDNSKQTSGDATVNSEASQEGEGLSLTEAFEESGEKPPAALNKTDTDKPADDTSVLNKNAAHIAGKIDEKMPVPGEKIKTSPALITDTHKKDIKTVLRALDPDGKPLTRKRLVTAHNAFNRILEVMTDAHVKPG